MIRLATVFSGIGAIEQALKRMNLEHEIVFACDNGNIDPFEKKKTEDIENIKEGIHTIKNHQKRKEMVDELYGKSRKTNFVQKSYLANYKLAKEHFYQDITFLDGKPYKGKVDLFVGGSPCQSFSISGKLKGLDDTRGTLFYEFARLVKEMQPEVFIYENVKGMLIHDKGKTWNVIKNVFDSLGYTYDFAILNSKDYRIPQTRNRLFVIGFKGKKKVEFSFPAKQELQLTMQDLLETDVHERYFLSDKLKKTIMSPGTKSFNAKPEINLKIARTLLSTMHKMHRAGIDNYVTNDGTENGRLRRLTPRECLRLMGFSEKFEQVVSDTQIYKQAGNSIVVDVLISIMEEIMKTGRLEQKHERE